MGADLSLESLYLELTTEGSLLCLWRDQIYIPKASSSVRYGHTFFYSVSKMESPSVDLAKLEHSVDSLVLVFFLTYWTCFLLDDLNRYTVECVL